MFKIGWGENNDFFFQFQVVAPWIGVLNRYMSGASLQEYQGSGGDRNEDILAKTFCPCQYGWMSKIELPYFSVAVGNPIILSHELYFYSYLLW